MKGSQFIYLLVNSKKMGAAASLLAPLTPEQRAEVTAEIEKLKADGISEEDIEKSLKEKFAAWAAAPTPTKPLKIIIAGAPASGKGKKKRKNV